MKQFIIFMTLMAVCLPVFALTGNQNTVIDNAMGGYAGTNGINLANIIKYAIAIGYLLWMGWLGLSSFSSWANNESSIADMSYMVVHGAAIVVLVVWVVT